MNEHDLQDRIEDALRAGDPADPRYQPLGRSLTRPVDPGARPGRARPLRAGLGTLAAAVVLLAVVLVMPLLIAAPPERPDATERARELQVLVRDDAPQAVRGSSVPEGFDVDVARAVGQELRMRAIVTAVDVGTIAAGGWGDRWDLAFDAGVAATGLPDTLRSSDPYYERAGVILVPSGSPVAAITDLAGARVCVLPDSLGERWARGDLDRADGAADTPPDALAVETAPTLRECDARAREGTVDAVVADWEMDAEPVPAGLRRLATGPFTRPVSAVVPIEVAGAGDLLRSVDAALDRLRREGTLQELSERRFGGRDLTDLSR